VAHDQPSKAGGAEAHVLSNSETIIMANKGQTQTTQRGDHPKHEGGANVKNAQQWGGGSKGA